MGAIIMGAIVGLILGVVLGVLTDKIIFTVLNRYEERVHQQTLAQARQLVDAGREHMVRPDADAPARIHKAHLSRKHKDDW